MGLNGLFVHSELGFCVIDNFLATSRVPCNLRYTATYHKRDGFMAEEIGLFLCWKCSIFKHLEVTFNSVLCITSEEINDTL